MHCRQATIKNEHKYKIKLLWKARQNLINGVSTCYVYCREGPGRLNGLVDMMMC